MVCKRKLRKKCRSSRARSNGKNAAWIQYPSPHKIGFGHGKFCYFISCPDSELPIRDYVCEEKPEPHYETKSYNEYRECNQRSIRNAKRRGISYIIFYTRYQGKTETYRNRYFITGLFPISASRKIGGRTAYYSTSPIFLSIEDSKELDDKTWRKWFGTDLPTDREGSHNLHYMTKFVEKDSLALKDIIAHFTERQKRNKLDLYVKELRSRST